MRIFPNIHTEVPVMKEKDKDMNPPKNCEHMYINIHTYTHTYTCCKSARSRHEPSKKFAASAEVLRRDINIYTCRQIDIYIHRHTYTDIHTHTCCKRAR